MYTASKMYYLLREKENSTEKENYERRSRMNITNLFSKQLINEGEHDFVRSLADDDT